MSHVLIILFVVLDAAAVVLVTMALWQWPKRPAHVACPACGSGEGAVPIGSRICTACGASFKVNARRRADLPTRKRLWAGFAVGIAIFGLGLWLGSTSGKGAGAVLKPAVLAAIAVGCICIQLLRHYLRYGAGFLRASRYWRVRQQRLRNQP